MAQSRALARLAPHQPSHAGTSSVQGSLPRDAVSECNRTLRHGHPQPPHGQEALQTANAAELTTTYPGAAATILGFAGPLGSPAGNAALSGQRGLPDARGDSRRASPSQATEPTSQPTQARQTTPSSSTCAQSLSSISELSCPLPLKKNRARRGSVSGKIRFNSHRWRAPSSATKLGCSVGKVGGRSSPRMSLGTGRS